ncbi:VOC family protein [Tardiphaga alba]|uniref:VOC family protein n=1 Tax=Tardiphaga alba TaxID=340268 RepID=A0ABX8ADZ2_9BRAD|nr:VOC family protein [Tardiphaga alba]QUS40040.1 VOC family protein [Tardiphaga alba]
MAVVSELALDHLGLAVRDLEKARAAFARLGFNLSSRSMHAGSVVPGGPVVPWGSGNHCAMFRRGYFELLGLVDDALPSNVKQMVSTYEGLHIVALACQSADIMQAELAARGVAAAKPITLERDAAFGASDEDVRRARFRNVYLDSHDYPDARFIVIEHDTREVLWQQHLMLHPNGAEELRSTYLVTNDVDSALKRLALVMGPPVSQNDAYRFAMAHGSIWVMTEATMRAVSPVANGHPVNRVGAACIGVRSLPDLKAHLDRNDVPFVAGASLDSDDSIWVAPTEASHSILVFVQTA